MPTWPLRYGIEVALYQQPTLIEIKGPQGKVMLPRETLPELIEILQQVHRFKGGAQAAQGGRAVPMKSTAQRKKLHAMADRGQIGSAVVAEFEAATPKGKKLPAKVGKKLKASRENNAAWRASMKKPKAKRKKPSGY